MDGRIPQRIVCLTAETAELAFALGCGDRVVGVTGYAVRPPEVRRKPRVSAFRTASVERIITLQPDLVLGFSDLQSDIAAALIRAGLNVLVTNQRTLEETYAAIEMVGRALGKPGDSRQLAERLRENLESLHASHDAPRPAVLFEEWDEPLISGIAWVSEIVELAGGRDVFAELSESRSASDRIVDPAEVVARRPDIVIASWCGKKARLDRIAARPGWGKIPAVQSGHIYEVKSADILQPGLSLVHGAREIASFIQRWREERPGTSSV